jgi:hypothetical protein
VRKTLHPKGINIRLNEGLPTHVRLSGLSPEAEKAEFEFHDLPPPDIDRINTIVFARQEFR